jgi:hypothetical protein
MLVSCEGTSPDLLDRRISQSRATYHRGIVPRAPAEPRKQQHEEVHPGFAGLTPLLRGEDRNQPQMRGLFGGFPEEESVRNQKPPVFPESTDYNETYMKKTMTI